MKQIDINQNVTTLYFGSMQNTRIQRVCGAMQISTIRDLCLCTAHDLANMRGMGCASLKKVKEVLGGCGLRLGMTEEEVKGAYEKETGNVIVKRFKGMNPVHTPGVLVKNHGPFSWGKDAHDAVHNAVVMEQVAKMASIAYAVNPNLTMNPLLVEKHFSRKHGPNAYYGQKK